MTLRNASLGEVYVAWTLVFILPFSIVAIIKADNNLRSIIEHLAVAGAVAMVVAAWFAVPMWAVIRLAA